MLRTTMRAGLLAALLSSLFATLAGGVAAANPADGFRNTQDYAYADLGRQLDYCHRLDAWVALVAGDRLKNPINDGAPRPWSDVTVTLWLRNDCSGTTTELTGFVVAPPDITRLEQASAHDIAIVVADPSGQVEAEVVGTFDWTVSGRAETVIQHDVSTRHFRSDRVAPADAIGGLSIADADGDFWPGGIDLSQDTVVGGSIGWANEIVLCCT